MAVEIQMGMIAADLGRLKKHLAPMVENFDKSYTAHMIERLSNAVEAIDTELNPTAAELVNEGMAVDEALAAVDRRRAALLRTLGQEQRAKDLDPGLSASLFLSLRQRRRAA